MQSDLGLATDSQPLPTDRNCAASNDPCNSRLRRFHALLPARNPARSVSEDGTRRPGQLCSAEVTVNATSCLKPTFVLVGGLWISATLSAQPLERPDWRAHFRPDGTAIRAAGVLDALFLEDRISDGVGIDMSVTVDGARSLIDNGVVPGPDDLGNGYVLARTDNRGSLIYHVGVERLASAADTWVEFELNQGVVRVRSGAPWPIEGERRAGDLVVRTTYTGGALARAELFVWDGLGFRAAGGAAAGGPGCTDVEPVLVFCTGPPPLPSAQSQAWDAGWLPVTAAPPDSFIEIGVNVRALLGTNIAYTTIQVRTPRDIILDSFRIANAPRRRLTTKGADD